MLSLYISDKIRYTTQSTYELEEKRDHTRHYYGHKTAKDLLMLIPGDSLSYSEMENLFTSRALLNYCNDLIVNIIEYYLEMRDDEKLSYDPMERKDEIDFVHLRYLMDQIRAFDIAYLFLSEVLISGTTNLYTENLMNYLDFDLSDYYPLVDKKYPLSYFQVPTDTKIRREIDFSQE